MADEARTSIEFKAELDTVSDWVADGSIDEANAVWGMHDPPSGIRNVILRVSFSQLELPLWVKERPGFWTVTLTPPESDE